ncbi:alpha/beta fold hydrolase [Fulvivirga sp. RKSG066]|uniref:YheT family hydrolase n=1 Tax=Fulvivirga aurantia TaxID=2529383 RepID=UPI0012BB5E89|nr:alpha/beta fold hydrolase [Fulvivirga aurantia]MTI23038.1 alpha/beta fold hydrolase [Fulvivirga aurantia]
MIDTYQRPFILFSPHLETIYPALFRKVNEVVYERERIDTPDGDFLDLDWVKKGADKLTIISHGLEGSSDRGYIMGMAKIFSQNGYDALAWNFRGCSGEMNRLARFYHSGATEDLETVVNHAIGLGYKEINLVGFSLGGNLTLKYLGEKERKSIHRATVFSVPLNLHSSCLKISESSNFIYSRRFLNNLKDKIRTKARVMPDKIDANGLESIKTLIEFDDKYTAPLHGFDGALHYYHSCSSINFFDSIKVPTLIVNAANDPFLSQDCYPIEKADKINTVSLEIPETGGHVGFTEFGSDNTFWSEKRALAFIRHSK